MASKVALGFAVWVVGDGTADPVVVDITKDPIFFFSVDAVTTVPSLDVNVSPLFDIIKNPPTGVVLGSYTYTGGNPVFTLTTGWFTSASVSGYQITATPQGGTSGVVQITGLLTFD